LTRKLVTVRKVKELIPIPGADKIELCIVDGWQVVVLKDRHTVGEMVLYYEIDSFLPSTDHRYASFEERFTNWGEKRGMRLKTIKLRKQLSQGLVMPLADFPEVLNVLSYMKTVDPDWIGFDATELLGIEKWEPIEKAFRGSQPGTSEGKRFPAFIRKTDQERIQNYGALVERALDEEFEVTMKKDGSSLTVFRVDPQNTYYSDAKAMTDKKLTLFQRFLGLFRKSRPVYGICSRNVLLPLEGESNFHKAARDLGLLEILEQCDGESLALQGELLAPDIQDNYEKVNGVEFHLFDIFDIDKQEYMLPDERQFFAEFYGVQDHVSVLECGKTLREILGYGGSVTDVVKLCLDYAEGPGDNPGVQREGVVFKSLKRDFSFKAVSNSYLLKLK
jgi:RNA ligase (TIGR02306 family)